MYRPIVIFLLTAAGLMLGACKKNGQEPVAHHDLTGEWNWTQSGYGSTMIIGPANTGVQKKLVFRPDGTFTLTHNDSIGKTLDLGVTVLSVLLPTSIVERGPYSISSIIVPCSGTKDSALVLSGQGGYQFTVLNDTLHISPGPCLAPYMTTYIRSK